MKPPKPQLTLIGREKLVDYLLNFEHPENVEKTDFFPSLSYAQGNWKNLAAQFRLLADEDVSKIENSPFGRKSIQEGFIRSSRNRKYRLRVVWIVELGSNTPRLVTAYPEEGVRHD